MMSKVQCMLCLENCNTEGRGGGKGESANFKTKHTEPLTTELISSPYHFAMLWQLKMNEPFYQNESNAYLNITLSPPLPPPLPLMLKSLPPHLPPPPLFLA